MCRKLTPKTSRKPTEKPAENRPITSAENLSRNPTENQPKNRPKTSAENLGRKPAENRPKTGYNSNKHHTSVS